MRRFFFSLYVLTAALHVPFAFAAAELTGSAWVGAGLALFGVLLLRGRMKLLAFDRHRPALRMLLLEEPYFIHWCATVAAAPLALAGWLIALASGAGPSFGRVALLAHGAGLALALWAVVIRRRWVRVRTLDVEVPGLGEAFDGYRIAHLSDLHIGSFCSRERALGWVDKVNALGVDLVACTGDYVTSGVHFHADIAAVLGGLRGRDGVVAVMGNHDYFGDGEPLVTLLRDGGVEVLRNQSRPLARGGDTLTLAGVDDVWSRRASVSRTLAGRDPGRPLLVLAHDPKLFPELARRGAALVLSGHTHWGQLALPFLPTRYNLSSVAFRHHAGVYREGGSVLYVHPGLGTTGPPVRLGAAPEITVLRLRPLRRPAERGAAAAA